MSVILEVKDLHVRYGKVEALQIGRASCRERV